MPSSRDAAGCREDEAASEDAGTRSWRVDKTLAPRPPVKPVTRIVGAIENKIQGYGYRLMKIRTSRQIPGDLYRFVAFLLHERLRDAINEQFTYSRARRWVCSTKRKLRRIIIQVRVLWGE